jgi:hypothetical protein
MNLFVAAGVDLPSSGGSGKRAATRLPHIGAMATLAIEAAEREIDRLVMKLST